MHLRCLVPIVFSSMLPICAATISIQPPIQTVSPDQIFSLNILASGVSNLYAFQFDLGFAPSVLSATETTEGALLLGGGSTFFISGMIDNTAGTISFTANTLIGTVPGVNGSGTLATVQFKALNVGTTAVSLSNVKLLDASLTSITTTMANGSVAVEQANPGGTTPEPASFWLLAGASGVLIFVRHKRAS